jgi:hypothetical protein
LALMIFTLLLLQLSVFSAYSQPGDLALLGATPIQSATGTDILTEGKKTAIKIDIASLFHEMPVVVRVSPFYEGYFSVGPEDYAISVKPGLHSYYLPPFDLIPKGSEFCIKIILDPYNKIQEAFENNNIIKNSCFQIKDTKPFKVLYIPIRFEGDPHPSLSVDQLRTFAAHSSSFIKATYPVAQDEFSYDIYPFEVSIPGYEGGKITQFGDLMSIIRTIDQLKFILYPGVPGIENINTVGIVRENWLEENGKLSGIAIFGDDVNQVHTVLVDPFIKSGVVPAQEIAHTYGWVDEAHSLPGMQQGHFSVDAPGYWVERNCEMGDWFYPTDNPSSAICFEGNIPKDFMYPCSGIYDGYGCTDNEPSIYQWISKPTFKFLLDKLSLNPMVQPIIQINGVTYSNGTARIFPWFKLNGTLDVPLNNPGNLTVAYVNSDGIQIAQTGINVKFHNLTHFPSTGSSFGLISAAIPDLHGVHKIAVKNGTKVLFERIISATPPQIHVMTPNGGGAFNVGNMINVTWNSAAQRTGNLTYVVSLSQDNGETWVPLALNLKNNSYSFVLPSTINNTKSALIKVSANDGINTVEDVSDSTFAMNKTVVKRS